MRREDGLKIGYQEAKSKKTSWQKSVNCDTESKLEKVGVEKKKGCTYLV